MLLYTLWLILGSLHDLFDELHVDIRFLDSPIFQLLLKPIVSQLVVDPPVSIEDDLNVPSVSEVDDLLVACITQMAVTVGLDDLRKQLSHEVRKMRTCDHREPSDFELSLFFRLK